MTMINKIEFNFVFGSGKLFTVIESGGFDRHGKGDNNKRAAAYVDSCKLKFADSVVFIGKIENTQNYWKKKRWCNCWYLLPDILFELINIPRIVDVQFLFEVSLQNKSSGVKSGVRKAVWKHLSNNRYKAVQCVTGDWNHVNEFTIVEFSSSKVNKPSNIAVYREFSKMKGLNNSSVWDCSPCRYYTVVFGVLVLDFLCSNNDSSIG